MSNVISLTPALVPVDLCVPGAPCSMRPSVALTLRPVQRMFVEETPLSISPIPAPPPILVHWDIIAEMEDAVQLKVRAQRYCSRQECV